MTQPLSSPIRPVPIAFALGVLGGAALVATTALTTFGPAIFLPYAALVLASLVAVRLARLADFSSRFGAALLAFMVASVVLYLFIETQNDTASLSAWGHTWRLGLMAGIGSVFSAAVATLAPLGQTG